MTKPRSGNSGPQPSQQAVIDDLHEAADATEALEVAECFLVDGEVEARIRLTTTSFERVEGGMELNDTEDFIVRFVGFPYVSPRVRVEHVRWAKQPHVLVGSTLCIYLDETREWNPAHGVTGFLDRLWRWIEDAAANRFDPKTALYQPVGGVLHRTKGAPTLVIGDVAEALQPTVLHAALSLRSPVRLDVVGWGRPAVGDEVPSAAIILNGPLLLGGGLRLGQLLKQIGNVQFPTVDAVQMMIRKVISRSPPNVPIHLIVAARNLANAGDAQYHVLCCRFMCSDSDPVLTPTSDSFDLPDGPELTWLHVDDCRAAVTVRRDVSRPVDWFLGRTVELWGCGALGSWIAELLVRAGVGKLILRDPGMVTTGLLVRQNFVDDDIGHNKAVALARRLNTISDNTDVVAHDSRGELGMRIDADRFVLDADLVIDATINMSVRTVLNAYAAQAETACHVAQIATDVATATLGVLTVISAGEACRIDDLDRAAFDVVTSSSQLEAYACLWEDEPVGEIVPSLGCSVPTFRGSAADASSIAATALSLLGPTLAAGVSGIHLFRLPYSSHVAPPDHWIPNPASAA